MTTKEWLYIVHSHELDKNWEPLQEYRSRLDKMWEISSRLSGEVVILLTGWKSTQWVDLRHCDAGYKYLTSFWINPDNIFRENDEYWSLETVWETVFLARDYFNLIKEFNLINLISSDYHQKRILEINRFILWKSRSLQFIWIPVENHGNVSRTPEQEDTSLNAFSRTFEWIKERNITEIENRLWQNHPLYKNHPSNPYLKN